MIYLQLKQLFLPVTLLLFFIIGIPNDIFSQPQTQTSVSCLSLDEHPVTNIYVPSGTHFDPVYLRIYIHVIRNSNGEGGQSPEDVIDALQKLEDAFTPHDIFFIWDCETHYIDDDVLFIMDGSTDVLSASNNAMNADNNHSDGIDIYLFPENNSPTYSYDGFASTDFVIDLSSSLETDLRTGIELYVGGNFDANPNTNMATSHLLSHEMGHCLGLRHTFQNLPQQIVNSPQCLGGAIFHTQGDRICDTPADPNMNYNVNSSNCSWNNFGLVDPNGAVYNPDVKNIMGYSSPECQEYFTAGQGLWMRDAIAFSDVLHNCVVDVDFAYENHSFTNANNIIGAGNHYLRGEITIEPGATLTVNPDAILTFDRGAKLIVKQDARLELYGTLTGFCGKTWEGVEVWSTFDQSQYYDFNTSQYYQGFVRTYKGSSIENAEVAMQLHKTPAAGEPLFGGGILRANGTTFKNNKVGIRTAVYQNFWSLPFGPPIWQNQPRPYDGEISKCNFITDTSYPHNDKNFVFANIAGIDGFRISGCSFINTRPVDVCEEFLNYGIGILAEESGFIATSACDSYSPLPNSVCNEIIRNKFEGLGYGVHGTNGFANRTFTVRESDFEGCHVGIFSEKISFSEILHNTFSMGNLEDLTCPNALNELAHQLGVQYTGKPVMGIVFQENEFIDLSEEPVTTIGTSVFGINSAPNNIRRNTFEGLDYANLANERNGDDFGGVVYLCNQMTNIKEYDFAVIQIPNAVTAPSIRTDQGEFDFLFNVFDAAGNEFSDVGVLDDNNHFRNDNLTPLIRYHYLDEDIPPNSPLPSSQQEPLDYLNLNKIETQVANTCEVIYCLEPCPILNDLNQMKMDFYQDKTDYLQAKSAYDAAILAADNPVAEQELLAMKIARMKMDKNAQVILREIMADTIGYSSDTIITWLGNVERYETDLMLASFYMKHNQLIEATNILNNASSKYNLSPTETSDLNLTISIYQLIQQNTLDGLGNNDLDNLKVIADDLSTPVASSLAKRIVQHYGLKIYPPIYFLPTNDENKRIGLENKEMIKYKINVQPNPADDYIEFTWDELPTLPSIKLYNAVGKLMWEGDISNEIDYFHLNTDFLQSGIYFYQLYSNGKPTYAKAGKLVIQKL